MKFKGKSWKFGDNIDTDAIIPARFLNVSDEDQLAASCFIDLKPEFVKGVKQGDVILAGSNFGCGSSREHAPLAIKASGVSVVVARSFARIFYRNAFNIGLPILECDEAVSAFQEGARLSVDLESGEIRDTETGVKVFAKPIPEFMQQMIQAGGLVPYIKANGGTF
ncbi:MAG: 3-isopropylmalate dehydratase small subunit [Desulfobacteraceae bacterium]|nr:MAG: 3-isopropylmalate dehydratase small subunit [Desulfobacteraceae bacterium]